MPRLGPAPVQPSFTPTIAQASIAQASIAQSTISPTPRVGFAPARATATASTSGAAGISIPRSQSASDRLSGMLAERPRSRSSIKSTKSDVATLPSDTQTLRSQPSLIAASRSNAADTPAHVFDAMARDVKSSTNTVDKRGTATAPSLKPKPNMDRAASPIPERTVASAGSRMSLESPAPASRQRSRKERNDKSWLPTGLDDDGEIELNHVDAPSTSASTSAVTLQSDGDEYVPPYAVRAGAFQSKTKPEGERYALTFTASLSSGADLPLSRRRLELELLWDAAQLGIWAYVPGAQYLPSWRLRAAGKLSGTEREEGWVRWVAGGMPVVGEAVREWL
ncbi:hypothetical protein CspHIS471_0106330 [Cutaneotrichosporon sp. HIS471]|nr:hypothetical protein CspHIS471_0106330 [Cutaneotrichosporon sp. HIS471]